MKVPSDLEPGLWPGWVVQSAPPWMEGPRARPCLHLFGRAAFVVEEGVIRKKLTGDEGRPQGDVFHPLGEAHGLVRASDFSPAKPRGEFTVQATAWSPQGAPSRGFRVGVEIGVARKYLMVYGERQWTANGSGVQPGTPEKFTSWPITWASSYGGKDFAPNPLGRGAHSREMHRIDSATTPLDRPLQQVLPVSLGPLGADWPQRHPGGGTFAADPEGSHWPWLPPDFDWQFFQRAARDQQIAGYWKGDETLRCQNLHPEKADLGSRLPGVRARCLVRQARAEDDLERTDPATWPVQEVILQLETLHLDMNEGVLHLLWRGVLPVRNLKFPDAHSLWMGLVPLGAGEEWRRIGFASLEKLRQQEAGVSLESSAEDVPATPVPSEAQTAATLPGAGMQEGMGEQLRALIPQIVTAARLHATAPPENAPGFAEMKKVTTLTPPSPEEEAVLRAQVEEWQKKVAGVKADARAMEMEPEEEPMPLTEGAAAAGEALAKEEASAEEAMAGLSRGRTWQDYTTGGEVALDRLRADGGALLDAREAPWPGLDFSGMDLRQANFTGANLAGGIFREALLSDVVLAGADLQGCDFSGAVLEGADLTGAVVHGAVWRGALCARSLWAELDLRAADLQGLRVPQVRFEKCDLEGADLRGALLVRAEFSGCNLRAVRAAGAMLSGADLRGMEAEKSDWTGAYLEGSVGDVTTNLTGATLVKISGAGLVWEGVRLTGANFSGSALRGARFVGASGEGVSFRRCDLRQACLEDANWRRADFSEANLLEAIFDRSEACETNFDRSNLYGVSFWETSLRGFSMKNAFAPRATLHLARGGTVGGIREKP